MKTQKTDQDQIVSGSSETADKNEKSRRLRIYGSIAAALVFGIVGAYFLLFSKAATPNSTNSRDRVLQLNANNRILHTNETLVSSYTNPAYKLVMQGDGNLVVYKSGGKAVWQSHTRGTGKHNRLVMQTDGNLVVYTSSNKPVWNTETNQVRDPKQKRPYVSYKLVMQTDGNLIIYGGNQPIWTSSAGKLSGYAHQLDAKRRTLGTNKALGSGSSRPFYKLVMQTDGNLVIYKSGGKVVWQSHTRGTGKHNRLVYQGDGNLVIYTASGKPVWNSETGGVGYLPRYGKTVMQGDGNLVIYDKKNRPVWSTRTGRLPLPAIPPSIAVKFNSYYCGGNVYPGYHFYQAQSNPRKPNDRSTSGCSGGTIGYILPVQQTTDNNSPPSNGPEGSVPLYYTRPTSLTRQNTFLTTDYYKAQHTIGIPQGKDKACFTKASTCRPTVIGYVQTSPKPDTTPLYGLYGTDSQTYYFTTSKAEHDTVLRNIQCHGKCADHGWSLGIVAYIYTKAQVGGSPAQ